MISCVAIDDEPLALEKLKGFLETIPFVELKACFTDCISAIPILEKENVDILFLDIQMEKMTGIQMLESCKVSPYVVIISAYREYALLGYELNVTDYILKPYSFDRLVKAITKIQQLLKDRNDEGSSNCKEFIFIKTDTRIVKIFLDDISYIEGMRDYLCIHTSQGKIMSLLSFSEILSLLPSSSFHRIHKSYIVNFRHIVSVEKHRVKINGVLLPVSLSYRNIFYKYLDV